MIASLPFSVFLVIILILLAMSGIAIYAGFHAWRRASLIRTMPTAQISTATDGYREFEGIIEAVPGPGIVAPLTRWPCCWYEARVEKHVVTRHQGSRQSRWETVQSWTSSAPFLCRDTTGVCIVDPHRAEVTPTDQSVWHGDSERPSDRNPPKVGPTESAAGMMAVVSTGTYRYTEKRIYAGDPILVLGEFERVGPSSIGEDNDEDEDEDEDEDDRDQADGIQPPVGGPTRADSVETAEFERDEAMLTEAQKIARATIGYGTGVHPFMITTTPQAQHLELTTRGGGAALGIALAPLALAAWLLWARYA